MATASSFYSPVRVISGRGAFDHACKEVGSRRAALVLSPHLLAQEDTPLARINLPATTPALIAPASNPTVKECLAAASQWAAIASKLDVVVAIGGGSAIDFAKMLATAGDDIPALISRLRAKQAIGAMALPLIAIPTTAGTGSEVTPWATVWDPEHHAKLSLHPRHGWAECAIVDPTLLDGCPRATALASGLDALSHALESIWNHNANPVSDALAMQAAQGLIRSLPAWINSADPTARDVASRSALLAGMAFSQTKTALAHALSYDVTLTRGVPHGIACSFSLPEVWRRAVAAAPERMQILSPLFGTMSHVPLAEFLEGLGVRTAFSEYGVDDIDAAIRSQLASDRGKNFIGAPTYG